jgi:cyclopropane fatty-acyl-phospholipid synthase-like methyltransferase
MNNENTEKLEMFSSEWYDEYFRRAVSSLTHAKFCELVYGKNLCQHGLMDMEELGILISLIQPNAKILEIGCSNGYITEYIQSNTSATILALDYSSVAIEQAKERTKKKGKMLEFKQADLSKEEIPGNDYDYIVLIDSIYFLGDFQRSIERLNRKLNKTGKMIITYFQGTDDEDGNKKLPGPDTTFIAKAFNQLGMPYDWYDFTVNVRRHGIKNYEVGEALKESFENEGNQFLYEARAAENRFFKESAENEEIVRYMYIVNSIQDV